MSWLLLSLTAPLLFAGTNFVEKYLLNKVTSGKSIASLSVMFGFGALPLLLILGIFTGPALRGYDLVSAFGAVVSGLMLVSGFYFYYRALDLADTSLVATLYQLIAVFNYFLGLIFLNEQLSLKQVLAASLIIFGSIILTAESHEKKIRFKKSVLGFMTLSSLLIAISSVVFKLVAVNTAFWPTLFYEYVGSVLFGWLIFAFNSKSRSELKQIMQKAKNKAIALIELDEVLNLGGIIALRYALILAPLAIVQAVSNGAQAVYLIVIGLVLTKMFPNIISENISRRHIAQKVAAILIMVAGTYLLSLYSAY